MLAILIIQGRSCEVLNKTIAMVMEKKRQTEERSMKVGNISDVEMEKEER